MYVRSWRTAVRPRQTFTTGELRGHHANVRVLAKPQLSERVLQRHGLALSEVPGFTKPRILRIVAYIDASQLGDRRCATRPCPHTKLPS